MEVKPRQVRIFWVKLLPVNVKISEGDLGTTVSVYLPRLHWWLVVLTCQEESDFRTVKTNERQVDGERFFYVPNIRCILFVLMSFRIVIMTNKLSDIDLLVSVACLWSRPKFVTRVALLWRIHFGTDIQECMIWFTEEPHTGSQLIPSLLGFVRWQLYSTATFKYRAAEFIWMVNRHRSGRSYR